jgi:hypothetical protein
MPRRLSRVNLSIHPHAAADIQQQRQPHRAVFFRLEPDDGPLLAAFHDGEVVAPQVETNRPLRSRTTADTKPDPPRI